MRKTSRPPNTVFIFSRLLCLFAAISFSGCGRKDSAPPPTQVLRVSQRNEPGDLDPARITLPDEFAVLRALGEGLLIPAPNAADPLPGAAERFEVSPDGLTYTFHLRPGAVWSNGEPVTAFDFVESYRRMLTPATAAPKANVFFPVKNARAFLRGEIADFSAVGFRAADPHTLVVTLEQPSPRFPHYVASGPWIPVNPRAVAQHGRAWTRPENFVGNGPFTLVEWRSNQHLRARKNPRWRDARNVRLDEIHFVHFDDGDTEDRAFRAGQIDVTMSVPFAKVDVYPRERPEEFHRAPMIETRYLSFNTRRPPLDDPRVRRALSLAIDRRAIVERITRGGQIPASRLVPPLLRSSSSDVDVVSFDLTAARALVASTGIDPKSLRPLEITTWSRSQVPILEAIQATWRHELGVAVSISLRDAKVHLDALARGDYDIGFITAIPDVADPANLLGDFVSGASENYPQWSDAEFDTAFRAALATANAADRARQLRVAENRLLEQAPVAPLYFNTKVWLMSPRVRGWHEDGLWTRCYQTISLDE